MISIKEFGQHVMQSVKGIFRLTSSASEWNEQLGRESLKLQIADYSGKASLVVAGSALDNARTLPIGSIIQATIRPRQLDHMIGGTLDEVRWVDPRIIRNIARVIPITACPERARDSLVLLVGLIKRIEEPALNRFLSLVLNEHYATFCRTQAGCSYHHSYPGGLLEHNVWTALEAERTASRVYSGDPRRVEVIVTGALLHDLGKAIQIYKGQNNTAVKVLPHESLTLYMCGDQLIQLSQEWPEGGQLLAEILRECALPKASRKHGHDAELIHMADVVDVKTDKASKCLPHNNARQSQSNNPTGSSVSR